MMKSLLKRICLLVMFSCITTTVWAEDAPVYDVDSYPPQFDNTPPSHSADHAQAGPPAQTYGAKDNNNTQDNTPAPAEPEQQAQTVATPPTQSLSIDQRIARLENAVHADVSNKVSDLQTEVQSLRGQIEELNHQLQQLQTQQKSQLSQLSDPDKHASHSAATTATASADESGPDDDTSVAIKPKKASKKSVDDDTTSAVGLPAVATTPVDEQKAEPKTTAAAPAPTAASASASQPNVAEEQQIYQTAYNLIKAKKYSDAADTLQKMLQKYPSGQFAANAHYWLGELYGLMGKNDQSISEFANVVKNYPDSPKIADAQLKLGLIYAAQLRWPDARNSFKKVINHYPGTASAHLASEQLKQIKQAGH
jgi:tol-pal system protein YbgF